MVHATQDARWRRGPYFRRAGPIRSVSGSHRGGQALTDGTLPTPGGWNRILTQVADLGATIASLRRAGVHFRDNQPSGVAVRQVRLEDPSGNPIGLFEPAGGYHEPAR
jgi:hypothetical protein